jgi:hypothetical protein
MKTFLIILGLTLMASVYSDKPATKVKADFQKTMTIDPLLLSTSQTKLVEVPESQIASVDELEKTYADFDHSRILKMIVELEKDEKIADAIKLANKNLLSPQAKEDLIIQIRSRQALNKIVLEKKLKKLEEGLL